MWGSGQGSGGAQLAIECGHGQQSFAVNKITNFVKGKNVENNCHFSIQIWQILQISI